MSGRRTVLVTGGAGFIGSHTSLDLMARGYELIVADNYSNSSPCALERVQKLAGRPLRAYEAGIRDRNALAEVFDSNHIDAVIHFAGKKAVRESFDIPLTYYDLNVGGSPTRRDCGSSMGADAWRFQQQNPAGYGATATVHPAAV